MMRPALSFPQQLSVTCPHRMETFAKKRYAPREGSERSKADARGATKMAVSILQCIFGQF